MRSKLSASALAFVSALAVTGASSAVLAQNDVTAAIPTVTTTTQSRAASCDRACLEGFVDTYFAAVIADDPGSVPLARNVRFTEGQVLPLGEGLWKSMKAAGTYRLAVTDADRADRADHTVVEDHADPAKALRPWALRLQIADGRIAEIEQILERNPQTRSASKPAAHRARAFSTPIPAAERMSRAYLISTANKYFTGMQRNDGKGDYPFHARCDRSRTAPLEERADSRGPDASRSEYRRRLLRAVSCREQFESGSSTSSSRIRDRRYVAVDQERGVVAAFAFFDHMAGSTRSFTRPDGSPHTGGPAQPWTWEILEFFKIEDGQLAEIEAFLTRPPYGMLSGWSTWENGMSDKIQDATGYRER